jgi:serine/threonine protein kinase
MPLSVGDKLGPYEILAPIGKGGMGEVYKARDTRLDRIVGSKFPPRSSVNTSSGKRKLSVR